MPPRRATVSAMRLPATAVMLATTTGRVVPTPSGVVRSTSIRDGTDERLGHHEHVAVRQVVGRQVVVEEAHGSYLLNRPFDANGGTPGTGSTVGGTGRSRH